MINYKAPVNCKCGKVHNPITSKIICSSGAISTLYLNIKNLNAKKPFVVADEKTFKIAGGKVFSILKDNNLNFSSYVFKTQNLEPNENSISALTENFKSGCDIVIGIGSGVINDLCKILAKNLSLPYIIIATAPSMDGYCSATSSVSLNGLKVSLPTKCADVVIGDIDILKTAPLKMLVSGLGDMLAKYISICEWRISNIITNEYYCEEIANLIRTALKKCVENIDGILNKDENAIQAVFEGLALGGIAMNYAGISRPASGVEHYFSHILDMRNLEFNAPCSLHGIQCAIGTLYTIKFYEKLKLVKIDKEKALNYVKNFDYSLHMAKLKELLGKGAIEMIALEKKEQKYSPIKHEKRLDIITKNWNKILEIINSEIPPYSYIEDILNKLNAPKFAKDIGVDENLVPFIFKATKDIRDKYVLSRLLFDLGVIDEFFC